MTHRLFRGLSRLSDRLRRRSNRTGPRAAGSEPAAPAFRVERRTQCLADLDRAEMRDCIRELAGRAEACGCVIFSDGAPSDHVVVVFAGNGERFFMLAAARHIRAPVIYLQDPGSPWYQGSALLPDVITLCTSFLIREIGDRTPLLFGQSSGGYAALVASSHFGDATVVAVSPQTFSDRAAKAAFCFVGVNTALVPDGLIDLRALFSRRSVPAGARMVLFAASEAENPVHVHYWMDHLHALRLTGLPTVQVYLVRTHNHAIAHQRLDRFADLLERLLPLLRREAGERVNATSAWAHETFVDPG